jgi:hypothetical protein
MNRRTWKDAAAALGLALALVLLVPLCLFAQDSSGATAAGDDPIQLLLTSILPVLAGALAGPLLTWAAKKLPFVDEGLGAVVNIGVTVGLYLLGWAVFAKGDRQQLATYMMWALAAAGVGGAGNNLWRKRLMPGSGSS